MRERKELERPKIPLIEVVQNDMLITKVTKNMIFDVIEWEEEYT